jgi:hypothetical protein
MGGDSAGPDNGARTRTRSAAAAFVVMATIYSMATIVFIHVLRPGDDPLASPISQYAVGRFGYLMTACLLLWGLAGWALAAALSRGPSGLAPSRVGFGLWVVFGAGLVVAAFVPVDVPYDMWNMSPTGKVHVFAASVSTFTAPIAALLLPGRSSRRSRAFAWVLLAAMPTVFLSGAFVPAIFGLVQKVYALLVLTWMLLEARSLMRTA